MSIRASKDFQEMKKKKERGTNAHSNRSGEKRRQSPAERVSQRLPQEKEIEKKKRRSGRKRKRARETEDENSRRVHARKQEAGSRRGGANQVPSLKKASEEKEDEEGK